jgi:predicted glycogen debranching enzyme
MNLDAEWLETDGLGGFASGTVGGPRTRRYHGLLVHAATPPTGRVVLVNGFDAFVETDSGRFALSTQRYAPDVLHPDGRMRLVKFENEPWPRWTFRLEDETEIVQEIVFARASAKRTAVLLVRFELVVAKRKAKPAAKRGRRRARDAGFPVRLFLRPFLSGRDFHANHRENPALRFEAAADGESLVFRPYDGVPAIHVLHDGDWRADPAWYRGFLHSEEQARGFDPIEDCASPGEIVFDFSRGPAVLMLAAERPIAGTARKVAEELRRAETKRRAAFGSPLQRAADQFLVARGSGRTIVAGYPWFADWGRDTFLSLRGLCLATGRLEDARAVLLEWSGALSQGMIPNRFLESGARGSDAGATPAAEYNSVDASLWFVVAVEELLAAARRARRRVLSPADERRLLAAVRSILEGYVAGTRFGIRIDDDELLAGGEKGQQLTWMDARIGDHEVTARIGKAVEVQALWHQALGFAASAIPDRGKWKSRAADVHDSFAERFWNERDQCLYDVVDVDHVKGTSDASLRPNQILAVGGLSRPLLTGPRARRVVDAVEAKLLTPLGLRTLAPEDPRYRPRYEGGPIARDSAYHEGTAWPWLLGPFVEAWIRVRNASSSARKDAQRRFVQPLFDVMSERGVSHLCEITDGEPPHGWRGCPFQAWSLAELLRVTSGAGALARAAS